MRANELSSVTFPSSIYVTCAMYRDECDEDHNAKLSTPTRHSLQSAVVVKYMHKRTYTLAQLVQGNRDDCEDGKIALCGRYHKNKCVP